MKTETVSLVKVHQPRTGTPPVVKPLIIHPSVDPELARGLIAACEYIADHWENFEMTNGLDREKGCVICHAERLSNWSRGTESGYQDASEIALGDWQRIYCPNNWPGIVDLWYTPQQVFNRITHFLETGE
jgi:hypothetical protein